MEFSIVHWSALVETNGQHEPLSWIWIESYLNGEENYSLEVCSWLMDLTANAQP